MHFLGLTISLQSKWTNLILLSKNNGKDNKDRNGMETYFHMHSNSITIVPGNNYKC